MGTAKLQTGTFRIIHVIELEAYEIILEDIRLQMGNLNESDPNYPIISHQITQITNQLSILKPRINRNPRSLNFLGSAWKWLAGSPDHDDFQILKSQSYRLLKNSNKQVVINQAYTKRINKLTNVTNEVMNLLRSNTVLKNQYTLDLKYKLDVIKEELTNIEYALLWAKNDVVSSFILSNSELKIVKERFEESNIPFINLEEALNFSEIKIASDKKTILYIISIPTTEKYICKKLLIKPVKYNNKIIKLQYENVLTCESEMYGIKKHCKTYNELTVCNRDEIVNLSAENCIRKLILGKPSSCEEINNQHVPTVEEIQLGTLFLNQFNGSITTENEVVNITGTFIIQFHNASITINGQEFVSKEVPSAKPLPAILHSKSSTKTYKELLTLEMLKELHINNTVHIDEIQEQGKIHIIANCTVTSLIVILIMGLVIVKYTINGQKEARRQQPEPQSKAAIDSPRLNRIPVLFVESTEDARA